MPILPFYLSPFTFFLHKVPSSLNKKNKYRIYFSYMFILINFEISF